MHKVIVIEGQTGTGKTQLAGEIARHCNGEIINADSRQIYRGADIGTNKQRFTDIPTHLLDIRDINEQYNAYQFREDALTTIAEILSRGKLPIVVGGTSFYIDVLTGRMPLFTTDDQFKEFLHRRQDELSVFDTKNLQHLYKSIDVSAFCELNNSELGNKQRLIRRIAKSEYADITTVAENPQPSSYEFVEIGIRMPYAELKKNIQERIVHMFSDGLVREVTTLISNHGIESVIAQTIGYSEFIEYVNAHDPDTQDIPTAISHLDTIALDFIKQQIYLDTIHFAKRQATWLKRNKDIWWIDKKDDLSNKVIFEVIKKIC